MMTKGTRVTETEKRKMWELYQQLGNFKKVAKKVRRSPDTVSKYVHLYEVEVAATGLMMNHERKIKKLKG